VSRTIAVGEACTAALKDAVRVGRERIYVPGQEQRGCPQPLVTLQGGDRL